MILYLAASDPDEVRCINEAAAAEHTVADVLVSYFYFRTANLDDVRRKYPLCRILADSGAYSAFTHKQELPVVDYGRWLRKWEHCFVEYANLDVRWDHEAGWRNQRKLEDMHLKPFPVYHAGEPWEVWDDMTTRYTRVAVGGMFGMSSSLTATSKEVVRWKQALFRKCPDETQIHAFGMTNQQSMLGLSWCSADSSSWSGGARYGRMNLFCPHRSKIVTVKQGDKKASYRERELLRSYDLAPKMVASGGMHWNFAKISQARSYLRLGHWLRRAKVANGSLHPSIDLDYWNTP